MDHPADGVTMALGLFTGETCVKGPSVQAEGLLELHTSRLRHLSRVEPRPSRSHWRYGNPLYLPDQQVGLNILSLPPRRGSLQAPFGFPAVLFGG